jgi:hypothetical protein
MRLTFFSSFPYILERLRNISGTKFHFLRNLPHLKNLHPRLLYYLPLFTRIIVTIYIYIHIYNLLFLNQYKTKLKHYCQLLNPETPYVCGR